MGWFSPKVERDKDGNIVEVSLFKGLWPSNDNKGNHPHGHTKMSTDADSNTAHVDYKRTGPQGSTPEVTKPSEGYDVNK